MTRIEKTARERNCVLRMIELLGLEVDGEPTSGDPKQREPDVLINPVGEGGRKRVGVEVRDLDDQQRSESWRGVLPRFQDRLRDMLAREAMNIHVSGYLYVEDVPMVRSRLSSAAAADSILTLARDWMVSPTNQPVHKGLGS